MATSRVQDARPSGRCCKGKLEATSGIEPLNRGFADPPLNHLGTSPRTLPPWGGSPGGETGELTDQTGCPSRIRTSPNGFKVRCPTTRRRGRDSLCGRRPFASATSRRIRPIAETPALRKWSGRRDSNPRPSPWQGDALPTEPLPLDKPRQPFMVPRARIELATPRFSVACSTD